MIQVKTALSRKITKIRSKVKKTDLRLSVSRSNKHLSAELIDLTAGKVKFGAIDSQLIDYKKKLTKTEKAAEFGRLFGAKLTNLKVNRLVFDRSGYRYHGRIKAFADGLRSANIKL